MIILIIVWLKKKILLIWCVFSYNIKIANIKTHCTITSPLVICVIGTWSPNPVEELIIVEKYSLCKKLSTGLPDHLKSYQFKHPRCARHTLYLKILKKPLSSGRLFRFDHFKRQ